MTDPASSDTDGRALLRRLASRARRRRGARYALWAVAAALLAAGLMHIALGVAALTGAVGCVVLAAGLLLGWMQVRAAGIDEGAAAAHLDRTQPETEESARLLLKDEEQLTPMQRLQRWRVMRAVRQMEDAVVPDGGVRRAGQAAGVALVLCVVLVAWSPRLFAAAPAGSAEDIVLRGNEAAAQSDAPAVEVEAVAVRVEPPAYMRLPDRTEEALGLRVPQDARLRWQVRLSRPVDEAYFLLSSGDSLRLQSSGDDPRTVEASLAGLDRSLFYALELREAGRRAYRSDYFPLDVTPDRPPVVTVEQPEGRTVVDPGGRATVRMQATAEDDYGVGRVQLVATVAKGSGENVKFREEALPLDGVERASRRAWRLTKTLDLDALGLEMGDELYGYVEAWDERAPQPQQARSETFFITRRDTSEWAQADGAALGVNPMPAYFRSQRQIIIDTKKLIAERAELSDKKLNERANRIGIDQKVLRLRYGKFLGEEFESGSASEHEDGLPTATRHDEHEGEEPGEADPREKLGGHAGHEAAGMEAQNPYGSGEAAVMQEYAHIHDTREGATFYSDAVKRELKAALAQMWEAELRLRTVRLEEALPYEQEALRMIKALQQKARVYVQRIGFEPPPLKPQERRLTGDLDDVESAAEQERVDAQRPRPELRAALTLLDRLEAGTALDTAETARTLQAAGETLGRLATEQAGRYLKALGELRVLLDALEAGRLGRGATATAPYTESIAAVRAALWAAMPPADPAPVPQRDAQRPLARSYFDALQP